jgi:uncharacterized membrane protein
MNPIDALAALWFLAVWLGYTKYAGNQVGRKACLAGELNAYRDLWLYRMLGRENRITDINSISNLERYVTFFASSTMLILAGLVTVLASMDKAINMLRDLPYMGSSTQTEWELKLLMMVAIFIHAFFKFSWSARQYGFASILIASAPMPAENISEEVKQDFVRGGARVLSLAALEFNKGLRAYYFSLAMLGWFLNAWIFMMATVVVVVVLYRREFSSDALRGLLEGQGKTL